MVSGSALGLGLKTRKDVFWWLNQVRSNIVLSSECEAPSPKEGLILLYIGARL